MPGNFYPSPPRHDFHAIFIVSEPPPFHFHSPTSSTMHKNIFEGELRKMHLSRSANFPIDCGHFRYFRNFVCICAWAAMRCANVLIAAIKARIGLQYLCKFMFDYCIRESPRQSSGSTKFIEIYAKCSMKYARAGTNTLSKYKKCA